MKKCTEQLPSGYSEIYSLDLQKDKKPAVLVNVIALLIAVVLIFAGHAIVPIFTLFKTESNPFTILTKPVILLIAVIVYMILHEAVHGIAMKYFGAKKVKYGFTGLYAFAASDAYFAKAPYIVIALAPIVFWGVVLLIINCIVPTEWFWVVWLIQISNLSGAAGDLYVTCKFSKFPKDILVRDAGVSMTVYSASRGN